jgi:hypothetical protein
MVYSAELKKHMYLSKEPPVLEEGPFSTLFPYENWDSFWKEFFLQIIVFKLEISYVCSK